MLLFAARGAAAQGSSFSLDAVTFSPSVYLTEAELQAAVAPYLGHPITFADVQAMVADVQRLYTASGIVTAKVVLLPQTVVQSTLRLELVEAKVGQVLLDPLGGTRPAFVRSSLSLTPGREPDYGQLERDLRIFEISHDFVPRLTFGPGLAFGTVDATVSGEVPKKFSWTASLDNFGTADTGTARATLAGRIANLTGVRDTLSFQAQASQGSKMAAVGYSRPLGYRGGRLTATASYTKSNVIFGTFAPLGIVSDTLQASVGYRRPFRVRPDSFLMFDASIVTEHGKSDLGVQGLQDTTIIEFVPQLSYSRTTGRHVLNATLGAKIGNADTIQTSETEGTYQLIFGNISYARRLGSFAVLEASGTLQLAPGQNLPVPRLISAGGPTSVRGYPNNVRSGDSGLILRAQLSKQVPWQPSPNIQITPFGFLDAALIVPYRPDGSINADQDVLYSAGAGGRFDFGNRWSMLAMVGVPLKETLGFTDTGKAQFYAGLDFKF